MERKIYNDREIFICSGCYGIRWIIIFSCKMATEKRGLGLEISENLKNSINLHYI